MTFRKSPIAIAALAVCGAMPAFMPTSAQAAANVTWSSPSEGATLRGTLTGSSCAVNTSGDARRVIFWVQDKQIGNDTTSPFNCIFDTTQLPDGPYVMRAVVYDKKDVARESRINVTIANNTATPTPTPPPGTGALDVWFKAPLAGSTISGTLNGGTSCWVNGTGVTRVVFFMDTTELNTDTTMSDGMQCVIDTTRFANGTHELRATAYAADGSSRSDVISVNVQNATPTPTPTPTPPSARAVPTFQSIGLYWTPPSNPGAAGCTVQFRKAGEPSFRQGLDMWYDSRNNECRGSLVELQSGTDYEVQIGMPGQSPSASVSVRTWADPFPVAQVVTLPEGTVTQPLAITQGGSAGAYVLYQGHPNGTTIDVLDVYDSNVTISAPYVILRGVTLKGARQDAIDLQKGARDVVIENNDISGWGRYRTTTGGQQVGMDMDSAVRARCTDLSLERVVIQRNRMHNPRYSANSWTYGHPAGPQAITFSHCGGNHVIRYNEIYSTNGNYFNDGIGGEDNFTARGFPLSDTDINGNKVSQAWDDGIESEGSNKNNRIWGNYLDQTAIGIASTVTHDGPLYIFRNVYNRSRKLSGSSLDADDRGPFFKAGTDATYGNGRRYVFHNTSLQAPNLSGTYPLGAGQGISGNTGQPLTNTVIRNNVFHIFKAHWASLDEVGGYGNDANYDLYNGLLNMVTGNEVNGIKGLPTYAAGHGYESADGGQYQLAPGMLGSGTGVRIPNFNDAFATPDIGAHQGGTPAMKFGVNQ